MKTNKYKLVAIGPDDSARILGYGSRAQVKANLERLRANGLPGFRYVMYRAEAH